MLVNGDYVSWKYIPLNYCAGGKMTIICMCLYLYKYVEKPWGITESSMVVFWLEKVCWIFGN